MKPFSLFSVIGLVILSSACNKADEMFDIPPEAHLTFHTSSSAELAQQSKLETFLTESAVPYGSINFYEIHVMNSGENKAQIGEFKFLINPSLYELNHNCPSELKFRESCKLDIRFDSAAGKLGDIFSTLYVDYNDQREGKLESQLPFGVKVDGQPSLWFAKDNLQTITPNDGIIKEREFPLSAVNGNGVSTEIKVLHNSALLKATDESFVILPAIEPLFSFDGLQASDFSIDWSKSTCSQNMLEISQVCKLNVKFNPTSASPSVRKARLIGNYRNNARSTTSYIELIGTATNAQIPYTISSVTSNIPATSIVGQENIFNVSIAKAGTSGLSNLSVSILGEQFSEVVADRIGCASPMVSASCVLKIKLNPTQAKAYPLTVKVNWNGVISDYNFSSTAIAPTLTASTPDFETIRFGESKERFVTFQNIGNGGISIENITLDSINSSSSMTIAANGNGCTGSIANNGSCQIKIKYSPTSSLHDVNKIFFKYKAGTQTGLPKEVSILKTLSTSQDISVIGGTNDNGVQLIDFGDVLFSSTPTAVQEIKIGVMGVALGSPLPILPVIASSPLLIVYKDNFAANCADRVGPDLGDNCKIIFKFNGPVNVCNNLNASTGKCDTITSSEIQLFPSINKRIKIRYTPVKPLLLVTNTVFSFTTPTGLSLPIDINVKSSTSVSKITNLTSSLSGPGCSKFTLVQACTNNEVLNSGCKVRPTFLSSEVGTFACTLTMTYKNAIESTTFSRDVNLTVVSTDTFTLAANPNSVLDYGSLLNSSNVPIERLVTLSKRGGNSSLTLSSANAQLSGSLSSGIVVDYNNCVNLGSADCVLKIRLNPSLVSVGMNLTGILKINYNNGTNSLSINLKANILSADQLIGFKSSSAVVTSQDFGSVVTNRSSKLSINISNTGNVPATLNAISIVKSDSLDPLADNIFSYSGSCSQTQLALGANCALDISFNPKLTQAYSGRLRVQYADSAKDIFLNLSGMGISPVRIFAGGNSSYQNTCILKSNGELVCIGSNDLNQTRSSSTSLVTALNTSLPIFPAGIKVKDVSIGGGHICAIVNDHRVSTSDTINRVVCWGKGSFGQLGTNEIITKRLAFSGSTVYFVDLSNKNVEQIATGDDHTCAMTNDAKLFCWGRNHRNQLGFTSTSTTE